MSVDEGWGGIVGVAAARPVKRLPLDQAGEQDLIAWCVEGDQGAFGELMGRYRRMLYGVCLRITANPDDASEALQETLIRVWRMVGGYQRRSQFSTWLYRVATNAALEEVRKRGRAPEPVGAAPVDGVGVGASSGARSARGVDDEVTERLTVNEALAKLPPPYRAAIVLRELCGCSYDEIAEVLEVPLNTVKSRIARGRQALHGLLA